jgi:aminoglycoside/choline kinase family phosphotransferase
MNDQTLDARARKARDWAARALGRQVKDFSPASADASFRRYFRLVSEGGSWIVMDAPPEHEDCGPFLRVAALMNHARVHVPDVIAQDLERGYLLLSDLGNRTYLDVLDEHNADDLFSDAIDALLHWQRASLPGVLPPYDAALLSRELGLFPDWYLLRHLRVSLGGDDAAAWAGVCKVLVEAALAQPSVYVHRDYMPRNLMLSLPNPGVLDFQDAVYGPLAYDPICLFKDAFISWPAERVEGWLRQYWERASATGLGVPAWPDFRRDCDWIGVQRHLKVLGIFARICYRDGKPRYLDDTPRFLRYVMEVAPKYPALHPLTALLERHVLPRVSI